MNLTELFKNIIKLINIESIYNCNVGGGGCSFRRARLSEHSGFYLQKQKFKF